MEEREAPYWAVDDNALTATYWETANNKRCPEPERDLMIAVLKVALLDFTKRYHVRDTRFQEARDWLFGRENDGVFAFESVCEVLRLSPGKIRAGLLRWIKQKSGRKAPLG
jgi:hypothetical protein